MNNVVIETLRCAQKLGGIVRVFCLNGFQINGLVKFVDDDSVVIVDKSKQWHALLIKNLSTVDASKDVINSAINNIQQNR